MLPRLVPVGKQIVCPSPGLTSIAAISTNATPGLLEQKGIHREVNKNKSGDGKDPLEAKINKPSLGQRIKNKLHTH